MLNWYAPQCKLQLPRTQRTAVSSLMCLHCQRNSSLFSDVSSLSKEQQFLLWCFYTVKITAVSSLMCLHCQKNSSFFSDVSPLSKDKNNNIKHILAICNSVISVLKEKAASPCKCQLSLPLWQSAIVRKPVQCSKSYKINHTLFYHTQIACVSATLCVPFDTK
jgi:hypothetical protein